MEEAAAPSVRVGKKIIVSILALIAVSAFCMKFISKEEVFEVVEIDGIPGILYEDLRYNNKLYRVDKDVVLYPERGHNKYHFRIEVLVPGIANSNEMVLEGSPNDFSLFVKELVFLDAHRDINTSVHLDQVASGGIDAIKSLIMGIIELVKDPWGAVQAAWKIGKDGVSFAKDFIFGEVSFEEIKRSVDDFANMFWHDTCAAVADENKLEYDKILFSSTQVVIGSMAKNRIAGRVLAEVAMLYFAFAKASTAKNMSTASKAAETARIFRFVKAERLIKPVTRIGRVEIEKHGKLVAKYNEAKSARSIAVSSRPPSQVLAESLTKAGKSKPQGTAAHHIVAYDHNEARIARNVLERFRIDINSEANGVWLPHESPDIRLGTYHRQVHTGKYFDKINELLSGAKSREEALEILSDIRNKLQRDTFPY